MALVEGAWTTVGGAALRWAIDVRLVVAASLLVFGWKRMRMHRRVAMS